MTQTLAKTHRRKILARMNALDMTRTELAARANVSRAALTSFLNDTREGGTGNPSLEWLDRVYAGLKKRRL